MAEQQLIDYIKKAKDAGQTDDQSKAMLLKNGWTEAEVSDAFASLSRPAQPKYSPEPAIENIVSTIIETQPEVKPQQPAQSEPQTIIQQEIKIKPELETKSEPQPTIQPEHYEMSHTKKSFLIIKLLIALIIIVVLCGVGYFVAGQYINLPWNPFKESPETVISKMMVNMKNVKSSHSIVEGAFSVADSNKVTLGKLSFTTETKADITDIKNTKANATFSIKLTIPGSTFSSSPELVGIDVSALVNIEVKTIANTYYFIINDITLPAAINLPVDVSQIKGKWFAINQDSINALSQLQNNQIIISDISQTGNPETVKKIQELIAASNIISFKNQLSDEAMSGQNAYHYLLTISKDKLKDLIKKIIDLQMTEVTKNETNKAINPTLVNNVAQAFTTTFTDAIGDTDIEMWIGKNDYMLYKIKINKILDASKFDPTSKGQLTLDLNITNSDFGKQIVIQTPENPQKIEDIIMPLMKTSIIQSDINNIGIIAQSLFSVNKSYYSLCRGGLLNGYLASYGTDLVNLNNDLVNQGATKPACFSGTQDYCISTQLPDSTYLCINKIGAGYSKCLTSKTPCGIITD